MDLLDNPIWHSLTSVHSDLAVGSELVKRYPAGYAPFVAVQNEHCGAELAHLIGAGDRVGILGVMPELTSDWQVVKEFDCWQYVYESEFELIWEPEAVALTEKHIPAMLELTALVYPSYFRAETASLGQYFGVFDRDHLCAMAGIRMSMSGYREISAVCTHPDYRGRGYASRLSRHLISFIQEAGDVPFLHTEFDNWAAQSVYKKLGMRFRRAIPFRVMERN